MGGELKRIWSRHGPITNRKRKKTAKWCKVTVDCSSDEKKKNKKIYFLLSFRPVKLAGLQGRQIPHFYFLNSNNYSRCRHLLSKVVEIQTKMTFEIFVLIDRRAVGHCPGGPGRCPLQQTSILSIAIRRILSVLFLLRWSRCRWLFGR